MRVHFSTSWIFRGWITCFILASCIQRKYARHSCIREQEYWENSIKKCCSKCPPGMYRSGQCTKEEDTKCRKCGSDEYQSKHNIDEKCLRQPFCDEGRGLIRVKPSSLTEPEPCQCKQGFQCNSTPCELCIQIPNCSLGEGLTGGTMRKVCKECPYGYFSDSVSTEACKKWTDCKALGMVEETPGSATADVGCGSISGTSIPWVMVAVPCIIILAFVVILTCYKDKLNLLSANLRNCVQNIKRSRIQQETLMPPYNTNGLQSCPLYDTASHLIRQDDNPPEYLSMCSETRLSGHDASSGSDLVQDQSQEPLPKPERDRADGSSSNSSEASEGGPSSPLSGSSCSCLFSMKEPMEVGENEDCSQLVATGLAGCCSCGLAETAGAEGAPGGAVTLVEAPLCGDCYSTDQSACLQGSQELYLDYSSQAGKETMSEVRGFHSDGSLYKSSLSSSDNRGLSLSHGVENNLSEHDGETELQSQGSDAALTCGQVSGNNNTTFISTGQVMNFTGDVIMVCISQTSLGSGASGEEPYTSPVQEESSEGGAPVAPKCDPRPSQYERQPPVQEVTHRCPLQHHSV